MRERNRPGTADAPVEKFGGGLTDAGTEVDLHSIRHPSSTIRKWRMAIRTTKSAWHSGGRGRRDTRGLAAPLILRSSSCVRWRAAFFLRTPRLAVAQASPQHQCCRWYLTPRNTNFKSIAGGPLAVAWQLAGNRFHAA